MQTARETLIEIFGAETAAEVDEVFSAGAAGQCWAAMYRDHIGSWPHDFGATEESCRLAAAVEADRYEVPADRRESWCAEFAQAAIQPRKTS